MTISIIGKDAADITRHARSIKPSADCWHEVWAMSACGHGCKLHVRRQGELMSYQLMHNATYGCRLAFNPKTAVMRVSVTAPSPAAYRHAG